jgi:hypothetical protein
MIFMTADKKNVINSHHISVAEEIDGDSCRLILISGDRIIVKHSLGTIRGAMNDEMRYE